eukprot:m.66724 g.66724  ORF g.66724 m.66724 type:complete len:445 (+) comp11829_c0_seq1:35-1369(+)
MAVSTSFVAVVIFAACVSGQNNTMQPMTVPQQLADKLGAKQLNGDAPIYLMRRNLNSDKWIVYLEGGGWCYGQTEEETIQSCIHRAGFVPDDTPTKTSGSTHEEGKYSIDFSDYGGILGANCTTNPGFCEWNAVFVHYRDGGSFGSNRAEPIQAKFRNGSKALMWMRGRPSFNAVVADLQQNHGMSAATEVILTGSSAGGLAVLYNLDHFAGLLGQNVRLTGFPDAGFFLDAMNVNGEYYYRNNFIAADPVWNITGSGGTNKACLASQSKATAWKCLMAQYIIPYLQTPLYVLNSAYDAYQLPNILQTPCPVSTKDKPCNATQSQQYGKMFKDLVTTVINSSNKNGVYVCSCWVHAQNVNYCSNQNMPNCVGWSPLESGSRKWGYTTKVHGLTPQEAFSAYYFNNTHHNMIDDETQQQNPTCITQDTQFRILICVLRVNQHVFR